MPILVCSGWFLKVCHVVARAFPRILRCGCEGVLGGCYGVAMQLIGCFPKCCFAVVSVF